MKISIYLQDILVFLCKKGDSSSSLFWDGTYVQFIKNCETRLKKEGDELLNELEELAQLVNKTLSPPSEMPEGVEQ